MPQCKYKSGIVGMDSLYTKIMICFPETDWLSSWYPSSILCLCGILFVEVNYVSYNEKYQYVDREVTQIFHFLRCLHLPLMVFLGLGFSLG